jgi:murein DD-endopeptidase MepM/ murein hydrolase activator NlpD
MFPGKTSRAGPITIETIGGNSIILDIGQGRYAAYAHLQPGSLRVKVGDRVKRGQVLGLVGNSGNSDQPHLHFQVVDRNSLLESEGVPYVLESFQVRGKDSKYAGRETQLPMRDEIIRFN